MVQQEVLVGVDDSAESHAALRWALRHARRSGSRVRAVSVFTPPLWTLDPGGPGVPAATGPVLESVERVCGVGPSGRSASTRNRGSPALSSEGRCNSAKWERST